MRFQNVGLRVTNLPKSLRFYTRALGFRVKRRGDTRAWGGGLWVLLVHSTSRQIVELNWYPKTSIFYRKYAVGEGIDHLDFSIGVASRAKLEATYQRLIRLGGRSTGYEPSTTEGWMASVLDPDGVWITVGRSPTRRERS